MEAHAEDAKHQMSFGLSNHFTGICPIPRIAAHALQELIQVSVVPGPLTPILNAALGSAHVPLATANTLMVDLNLHMSSRGGDQSHIGFHWKNWFIDMLLSQSAGQGLCDLAHQRGLGGCGMAGLKNDGTSHCFVLSCPSEVTVTVTARQSLADGLRRKEVSQQSQAWARPWETSFLTLYQADMREGRKERKRRERGRNEEETNRSWKKQDWSWEWGKGLSGTETTSSFEQVFVPPLPVYGLSLGGLSHQTVGSPQHRPCQLCYASQRSYCPSCRYGHYLSPWPDSCLSSASAPAPGFTDSFNMDTKKPRIIAGSRSAFFGYTVQQHDIGDQKW